MCVCFQSCILAPHFTRDNTIKHQYFSSGYIRDYKILYFKILNFLVFDWNYFVLAFKIFGREIYGNVD